MTEIADVMIIVGVHDDTSLKVKIPEGDTKAVGFLKFGPDVTITFYTKAKLAEARKLLSDACAATGAVR